MHENVLVYRGFKWLRLAAIAMLASLVAYLFDPALIPNNGGTWIGYILGTIGALLIFWLMWFGVRKRKYQAGNVRESGGKKVSKLEDWLSAHVYLGLSLIVIATLHCGFQFHWNVHTLAYVLMMLVIASGAFGVYAYLRYPALMTENRGGRTTMAMLGQLASFDADARNASMALGGEITQLVLKAQESRVGGGAWRQLSGKDKSCPTAAALSRLKAMTAQVPSGQRANFERLLTILSQKDELLQRMRRDVQLKALMDIWLYFHVPLTLSLIAALVAHIISVFFYW